MRAAACSSASGTDSFARWAAFERLPGPKIRVGMPADWNVAASVLPRSPEYPRSLPRIRAVGVAHDPAERQLFGNLDRRHGHHHAPLDLEGGVQSA